MRTVIARGRVAWLAPWDRVLIKDHDGVLKEFTLTTYPTNNGSMKGLDSDGRLRWIYREEIIRKL